MVSMCGLVPANNWGPKVQGAEGGRSQAGWHQTGPAQVWKSWKRGNSAGQKLGWGARSPSAWALN